MLSDQPGHLLHLAEMRLMLGHIEVAHALYSAVLAMADLRPDERSEAPR